MPLGQHHAAVAERGGNLIPEKIDAQEPEKFFNFRRRLAEGPANEIFTQGFRITGRIPHLMRHDPIFHGGIIQYFQEVFMTLVPAPGIFADKAAPVRKHNREIKLFDFRQRARKPHSQREVFIDIHMPAFLCPPLKALEPVFILRTEDRTFIIRAYIRGKFRADRFMKIAVGNRRCRKICKGPQVHVRELFADCRSQPVHKKEILRGTEILIPTGKRPPAFPFDRRDTTRTFTCLPGIIQADVDALRIIRSAAEHIQYIFRINLFHFSVCETELRPLFAFAVHQRIVFRMLPEIFFRRQVKR